LAADANAGAERGEVLGDAEIDALPPPVTKTVLPLKRAFGRSSCVFMMRSPDTFDCGIGGMRRRGAEGHSAMKFQSEESNHDQGKGNGK
jgi:hypothetical protein